MSHRIRSGWPAFWRLALGLVLGLLVGCNNTLPIETPPSEGQQILFSDDFSTRTSKWALFETTEGAAYIQQGELYLEDRGGGIGIYTLPLDYSWDDVVVDVRVRHIEGAQDNWMGVSCRMEDEENYYLFAISADGYYLILKVEEGFPTPLAGPLLGAAINTGRATNQLTVRCADDQLALSVNGDLVAARTDTSLQSGAVALFVDAVAPGSVTNAAFDALVIAEP